jgi:beta-1,4-mannosyltransferase
MTTKWKNNSVLAFPKAGIAYTDHLYDFAERTGMRIDEGNFSGFWLLKNLRKYSAIHIHWPSFFYTSKNGKIEECIAFAKFVMLLCYARLIGKRVLWTAHNLYPHDLSSIKGMHRLARLILVKLTTRIFVHGPTAATIFKREFGVSNSKISIIKHGNWIDYYPSGVTKNEARAKLEIDENQYVFLFFGLCKKYKNIHELVSVISRLDTGVKLLIAGRFDDPEYYSKIINIVDGMDNKRVRIDAWYIPDGELQNYMLACDAVVLPYLESLTSGAAVAALGFGRPVVAPRMGYLNDIISEKNGILYNSDNKDGLLISMTAIRGRTYSSKEIKKFARTLSWDSAVNSIRDNIV